MADLNNVELVQVPSKENASLSTEMSGKHVAETNSNSTPQNRSVQDAMDTSNPLNWSTLKKFYNMGVPSLLCFVM